MTKCAAYWRALDNGKECGAPKLGSAARTLQDEYRKGVVSDLVAMGLKEDVIYDLLYYTALIHCTPCPSILRMKRDSPYRKKMLDLVFEAVSSGVIISKNKDFYKKIADRYPELDIRTWADEDWSRHCGEYRPSPRARGVWDRELKLKSVRVEPFAITNRNNIGEGRDYNTDSRTSIVHKLRMVCTAGQFSILQDMVALEHGSDEYAAFCIALKWASERLDIEGQ
jgi:hypothetical protein